MIEVPGRTFPVEIRYQPLRGGEANAPNRDVMSAIADAVEELCAVGPGDVLVFLPGERDIRDAHRMLQGRLPHGTELLPLYARLSAEQQQRVFAPHAGRRIVLATNVAETSLTVPGIRYVVDPGLARISRYSARSRVQRLPIEDISQASANQRAGRCGRLRDGVCIRLYSQEDYESREKFTQPEIQRTDLAEVILRMKSLDFGEIDSFPFLDPPKGAMIRDGFETLWEIRAIDDAGELTDLGRKLARLPVPPRVGRMLVEAGELASLREVLIIAAALSIQDPRERPAEKHAEADAAQARFRDDQSDFLTLLNIWDFFHEVRHGSSWNELRRTCREHFLNFIRMREWQDVHHQLVQACRELGLNASNRSVAQASSPVIASPASTAEEAIAAATSPRASAQGRHGRAEYDAIHRALLAGSLSGVGLRDEQVRGQYRGPSGSFFIWPGSCLFRERPAWIMSSEIVETTRRYARLTAKIQPGWIEKLAQHLLKRSHSDPQWDSSAGRVMALERATLFGLPIYERRRVRYDEIDPVFSRGVFIEHALVGGNCRCNAPFMRHNRALIDQVRQLESKHRRHDLLKDVESRFAFFEPLIPAHVTSLASFEKWRKQAERANPRLLFMDRSDVLRVEPEGREARLFPDSISVGDVIAKLEYEMSPGAEHDGVTAVVPLAALGLVDERPAQWLVAGMIEEKIVELLRGLPKELRTNFIPAPDFARACVDRMTFGEGTLLSELSATLHRMTGVDVPLGAWQANQLAAHLRMRFRVVDLAGRTIASGRDLAALQRGLREQTEAALEANMDDPIGRRGIRAWDFGDLPGERIVCCGEAKIALHPALVDDGRSVSIVARHDRDRARRLTLAGLRRLFWLASKDELRFQLGQLPGIEAARLHYSVLTRRGDFDEEVGLVIAQRAFVADEPDIRTQRAFEQRLNEGFNRMWDAGLEAIATAREALELAHQAQLALDEAASHASWRDSLADMREQFAALLSDRFLTQTPWERLSHLPRYLRALLRRLEKLRSGGAPRDRQALEQVAGLWRAYLDERRARGEGADEDANLEAFRWMIEELRVSLFAQELGTAQPVSAKRLAKQWETIAQARISL